MSATIIAQVPHTALEYRIASEAPALDLETDLFTCTATDGQVIAAPTEEECNDQRTWHERIIRFRAFARCEPGSPEQAVALDALHPYCGAWPDVYREEGERKAAECMAR